MFVQLKLLQGDEPSHPRPTLPLQVGYSIEEFKWSKAKLTIVDLSGATKYQSLWSHYYAQAQVGRGGACQIREATLSD